MEKEERDALLDGLRATYQAIAAYAVPDGSGRILVIRKCNSAERARVVDKSADKTKSQAAARKELALAVGVYPEDPNERSAILEEWPALYDKLSDRAFELAGYDCEELGKD